MVGAPLRDAIARRLPRGYAALSDQLRRALLAAYLGIAEASSRQGQDRLARFRCARGEASEAAAAIEAVQFLSLAPADQTQAVLDLCDRLCAMLSVLVFVSGLGYRLAAGGERDWPSGPISAPDFPTSSS